MPDTINIPDKLPRPDRDRLERVNRNIQIRDAYPQLRDQLGRDKALSVLAERHGLSPASVREVVYGRQ
jgi:hypothetical protein